MINAYAALNEKSKLAKFKYDLGPLGHNEVEIDVLYCGICHSDISMIENEWGMSQYPLVPGHEVVGKISKIGKNVKNFSLGQKVGLGWHSGYCNHCYLCNAGDQNLCAEAEGTIVSRHGGFADKVRAQYNSVVKIPDGIDLESTGPLFCGGITIFNPLVQYNISPTSKVAVIGIGGLGHMAIQFLNAWGCEVTAFTSSASKREEALKFGADHALNSKDAKEIESVAGKFDLIISTVNVTLDWNLYIKTLAPKGRLHFVGVALEPLNIGVFDLLPKQNCISSSPVGSPGTIVKMLDFAKAHDIRPIVEILPMSKANEAINKLKSGGAHYRIVLKNDF